MGLGIGIRGSSLARGSGATLEAETYQKIVMHGNVKSRDDLKFKPPISSEGKNGIILDPACLHVICFVGGRRHEQIFYGRISA